MMHRWWIVHFFSALCFHTYSTLSSLSSIYIDLNGPQAAGLNYNVEWHQGGGAVVLAADSASATASHASNSSYAECLVITGDAFLSHEVTVNVSADSRFTVVTTNNSTLQVCLRNVSTHNLHLVANIVKHLRFDCWMSCTYPSNRKYSIFLVSTNGSKSAVSEAWVWITSRPVMHVSDVPTRVLYTEGSQPVLLFGNSTVIVRLNRQPSLRMLHIRLTLLDSLDAQHEMLSINATNVNATYHLSNRTGELSLVFEQNASDVDVVNALKLIKYYTNGLYLHSGVRRVEVIISNGLLFSDPAIVYVDVHTSLVISDIPQKKYWQAVFARPLPLAQNAKLSRSDKRDTSPVYWGQVQYNFTSSDWTPDPLTRMQCSKLTNPVTKLKSCINSGSEVIFNLIDYAPYQDSVETVADIQRYNFPAMLNLIVSRDHVAVAPWSLSVWVLLNVSDNHLLITKDEPTTNKLIYQIGAYLDNITVMYNSTLNESVMVTFSYPLLLDVSLWHHFVFMAGSFGVMGYVDGQLIDVTSMKLNNKTLSGHASQLLPSLMDQPGRLEMSVVSALSNAPAASLAGVMMSNHLLTDLQVKCVAGCEEQLHVNTDIIPYNLIKQLKPMLSDGGQVLSLSGPASLDAYTLLLQSLAYVNFANASDKSPRSITFHVSDMTFRVQHDMQLVHICDAADSYCGRAANVTCEMVDSTTHQCICPTGFLFDMKTQTCKMPVSCADQSNVCGNNSHCTQMSEVEVSCDCISGFEKVDDFNCININVCVSAPCHNGGTCVDGINTYSCICLSDYTGDSCDVVTDMCLSNPCVHGRCEDNRCVCNKGYNGSLCEVDVRCVSTGCLNGGTCIEKSDGNYSCQCLPQFYGLHCQFDVANSTDALTTTTVVAIGVSIGVVVVLVIVVVAIFITLRRQRTKSLMVEGRRRMRFTYSQYLGETSSSSRRASRKSYSVVQPVPSHNHWDLKSDSRPAVRRLSIAFKENGMGSMFGSIPGSLHEMTMPGLFRPRSNTDTSEFFRTGTALPNVDEDAAANIINSNFTADDILESNEHQTYDKQDEITEEEDDDSTYINSNFDNIFENFGERDSVLIDVPGRVESNNSNYDNDSENASEVMSQLSCDEPLSKVDHDHLLNDGLLTPGQVRARQQAIAMLSDFSWADNVSDDEQE